MKRLGDVHFPHVSFPLLPRCWPLGLLSGDRAHGWPSAGWWGQGHPRSRKQCSLTALLTAHTASDIACTVPVGSRRGWSCTGSKQHRATPLLCTGEQSGSYPPCCEAHSLGFKFSFCHMEGWPCLQKSQGVPFPKNPTLVLCWVNVWAGTEDWRVSLNGLRDVDSIMRTQQKPKTTGRSHKFMAFLWSQFALTQTQCSWKRWLRGPKCGVLPKCGTAILSSWPPGSALRVVSYLPSHLQHVPLQGGGWGGPSLVGFALLLL